MIRSLIKNLNVEEQQKICKSIFWGLFALYAIYQANIFMHWRAMVPDEIHFIGASSGFNLFDRTAPPANYGSIYWLTLKLLHYPVLIRFFMGTLFLTIPLLVIHGHKSYQLKLFSLLLYLSFPYAFWTGKLIGPEIPALWCIALSLALLPKKPNWSAVLAGLSIGIKLTSLPFLVFFFPLAYIQKRSIKHLAILFTLVTLGFLLANPVNADLYLLNIAKVNLGQNQTGGIDISKIIPALFQYGMTWDNVIGESFSQLISNPYLCLLYGLLLFITTPLYGAIFIAFLVTTLVSISTIPFAYVWYFFTVIPIWIYSIKYFDPLPTRTLPRQIICFLLGVIFLFNFSTNMQYSIFQSAEKFYQIRTIENFPRSCVSKEIALFKPTVIMDRSDFGWEFNAIPSGLTVQMEDLLSPNYLNDQQRVMVIASSRMLIHIPQNFYLNLRARCEDIFIFTN